MFDGIAVAWLSGINDRQQLIEELLDELLCRQIVQRVKDYCPARTATTAGTHAPPYATARLVNRPT